MADLGFTWKLCDLMGHQIGSLENRLPGGKVDVGLNEEVWKASVPFSFDDPPSALAVPLYTVLKCSMDGEPLFSGVVVKPRYDGRSRVVTVNALGQGFRLQNLQTGIRADGAGLSGAVSWNPWRWENLDQAEMFARLMEHVQPTAAETIAGVPGHGIERGTLQSGGILRTRDFDVGTPIWPAWTDLSALAEGCDFTLRAVDEEDGTLCLLDTFHPMMGSDKTDSIRMHYGWGRENATDFSYEPDGGPVRNRVKILGPVIEGEPQHTAVGDQPESQIAFGIYSTTQGRTDLYDPAQLAEVAQGDVSTIGWTQDFFTVTPAMQDGSGYGRDGGELVKLPKQFGRGYLFGPGDDHDFWIGDIIAVVAKDGPLNDVFEGRVQGGSLTEADEAGNVVAELQCTPLVSQTGVEVVTT